MLKPIRLKEYYLQQQTIFRPVRNAAPPDDKAADPVTALCHFYAKYPQVIEKRHV